MDEEPKKPQGKINLAIGIFVTIIVLITDIIDEIPLVGTLTDMFVGAPLSIWLFFEGVRGTFVLVGNIIEAIPILQELPLTRTITWLITWWIDAHPKLEKLTEMAGGAVGGGEAGALAEEAEAGEKAAETAVQAEKAAEEAAAAGTQAAEAGAEAAETTGAATSAAQQAEGATEEVQEVGGRTETIERSETTTTESGEGSQEGRAKGGESGESEAAGGEEGGQEGSEKPSEEGGAKGEEEKRIREALGEQPEPMEEVENKLFEGAPESSGQEDEDEEDQEGSHAARRNAPAPPPKPGEKKGGVTDIRKGLNKTADLQKRWRENREDNDQGGLPEPA